MTSPSTLPTKPLRASLRLLAWAICSLLAVIPLRGADTARQTIAKAILEEDGDKKTALINSLVGQTDESIPVLLATWKADAIFLYKIDDDHKVPVTLLEGKDADDKQAAVRVDDGKPLVDQDGKPVRLVASDLDAAEHDSNLRATMKGVLDLLSLTDPNPDKRMQAIVTLGMSQETEKLPQLLKLQQTEKEGKVKRALSEAVALMQLKDENPEVQIAAAKALGEMGSIPSRDFLKQLIADSAGKPEVVKAAKVAEAAIASHLTTVNAIGTAFRGLSLGSILLVAALGLAITFGLMGVINMAHGELIAVGAYTTYVIQGLFATGVVMQIPTFFFQPITLRFSGMNLSGNKLDAYFLVALPMSFLVAALVGILLERCVIRFLYRRPLESLLATWGVSLVLQQMFRLTFGANNVQVYSPAYLSGNWTVFDVILGWNRVFVICFAIFIIIGTHLLLTKTPVGLLIRAVTQNRQMAACMGVKTQQVNMLTFAFGAGLAGLAGAFLSQIGNVGPSLGQDYIVNAFMTVVVGGVGNLLGTVISALGIGLIDQSLQQILLNPVLGKILVLVGIILFLQWRPAGIFVTKSRSLEG
ncbi:MAG: urea ABC transporter permease subunit UrtB [Chthoniobacter sp.]|uniref:urea ABC transporter permease subunit UrtB n=1 Tax=Chthoniobacter sp. TaxID=2510640 RepID=UPI0032A52DE4